MQQDRGGQQRPAGDQVGGQLGSAERPDRLGVADDHQTVDLVGVRSRLDDRQQEVGAVLPLEHGLGESGLGQAHAAERKRPGGREDRQVHQ